MIGGAAAMGIGIGSMHFIGMLAMSTPMLLRYDVPLTLASLLIAVEDRHPLHPRDDRRSAELSHRSGNHLSGAQSAQQGDRRGPRDARAADASRGAPFRSVSGLFSGQPAPADVLEPWLRAHASFGNGGELAATSARLARTAWPAALLASNDD